MNARRPHGPAGLERDEALLAAARRELRAVHGFGLARERALVARILARTTRAGPAQRRVARADRRWLPLAAAGAVLAAASLWLRNAPHEDAGADAAVRVADLRADGGLADVLALARVELERTASAAQRTPAIAGAEAASEALELRLLQARAKGLRERRWDAWLMEVPLGEVSTLARALWCEVQLDRYVLCGTRPPAWGKALEILARGLAPDAATVDGPESSRLLAHALDRARDYGWTGTGPEARARNGKPLWSRQWFSDLEAAGREAGLADSGTWRAWVEWRGP